MDFRLRMRQNRSGCSALRLLVMVQVVFWFATTVVVGPVVGVPPLMLQE